MHAADPEEQLPLLYQVPLRRLVNWTKWWHIVARVVLRAFQRRYWGLLGNHLQTVTGVVNPEREHSEDSAGEKEAKRQRSNPGTPVSTPRRMPYDYDAVMGITRVGTREAEGFDEDLDSTEYHDANDTTEEPIRKEETETDSQVPMPTGFQGGYGSSSLKECIELLNTTSRIAPAPLDSGVGDSADPPHKYKERYIYIYICMKNPE